mgnify:CR=1 FL=1
MKKFFVVSYVADVDENYSVNKAIFESAKEAIDYVKRNADTDYERGRYEIDILSGENRIDHIDYRDWYTINDAAYEMASCIVKSIGELLEDDALLKVNKLRGSNEAPKVDMNLYEKSKEIIRRYENFYK